ncbi:MAG: hypothetical protein KatS3mg077_0687 [Candidatus Binatia bacterium]|nr:MAG: hypothetical protein KatS3mg077_0687 [Candidatus Binatia bacterium]
MVAPWFSAKSRWFLWPLIFKLVTMGTFSPALGCEICAIYTGTELLESRRGLRIGVAEQFTGFGTLQENGEEVANPADEFLDSSITQILFGYSWHPRLLLQANVPWIHREFRRLTMSGVERDSAGGLGDISIHWIGTVLQHVSERSVHRASVSVGVKLPTGSPSRLREELGDDTHAAEPNIPPVFRNRQWRPRHATGSVASGVHGHDLVLGSGSTDVVLGAQWLGTYRRFYGTAMVQYFVRTEGSFDYTFANETIVSAGPGLFLLTRHDTTLGLQALLTVDTKGTDTLRGERVGDTGATFLYAGPSMHWTWKSSLSADLALDLPALRHNTGLQAVPDFRLRGGLVWRF